MMYRWIFKFWTAVVTCTKLKFPRVKLVSWTVSLRCLDALTFSRALCSSAGTNCAVLRRLNNKYQETFFLSVNGAGETQASLFWSEQQICFTWLYSENVGVQFARIGPFVSLYTDIQWLCLVLQWLKVTHTQIILEIPNKYKRGWHR